MPAVHCTAVTHDVAPATTLVVPAAHAVQLEPVPLYPGAHTLHDAAEVEPDPEVVRPDSQGIETPVPVEYCPKGTA